MLRRVHLHGPFAKFHDGPILIEAATVWDAIEGVSRQIKGLGPDPRSGRKVAQVVGYETVESLRSLGEEDIHLVPAVFFGKSGGLIQIIVGSLLIAVGVIFQGPWSPYLISAGTALVAGGAVQLLMPQPQLGGTSDAEKRSKYLSGIQNTVAIGTPIPILYGRMRVGGQLLSLNIDAKDTGI